MQDTIIKGTGNSRTMGSVPNFLTIYPTYEDFAQALVSRTLPVDLSGPVAAGCDVVGTPLNKANLLTDATAALFGKNSNAVPDDIFVALAPFVNNSSCELITESKAWVAPFDMTVTVICLGGGGGGAPGGGKSIASANSNIGGGGGGGGSGYISIWSSDIAKGTSVACTIGKGGAALQTGGTTSFGNYVSALGGNSGTSGTTGASAKGGEGGYGAFVGNSGNNSSGNSGGRGGRGAASGFGSPGSGSSGDGGNASGYGSGGGGGAGGSYNIPSSTKGGSGSDGFILIFYKPK